MCESCYGRGSVECVRGPEGCRGSVAYFAPHDRAYPFCSAHQVEAEKREQDLLEKYGRGPCEPAGFDFYDAGEELFEEAW